MNPAGAFDPQGPVAGAMEDLWWLMFWLGTAVFVVFAVLLVVGLFRRRTAAGSRVSAYAAFDLLAGGAPPATITPRPPDFPTRARRFAASPRSISSSELRASGTAGMAAASPARRAS